MPPKKKHKAKSKKPATDKRDTDRVTKTDQVAENGAPIRQPIERKRVVLPLPVPIDAAIMAKKGDELATANIEREKVRIERREANAGFREAIAAFDKQVAELSSSVKTHTEIRPVECVEQLIVETQTIETMRLDTKEILAHLTRAATGDDVQEGLGLPPDEGDDDDLGEDDDRPPPDPSSEKPTALEEEFRRNNPNWREIDEAAVAAGAGEDDGEE